MAKKRNRKKRILKHIGNVGTAIITSSLITSPSLAANPAEVAGQVIGAEGDKKAAKEVLDAELKMAKSKPAMSATSDIVCPACIPTAVVAVASPEMCIACGILIAKKLASLWLKFL